MIDGDVLRICLHQGSQGYLCNKPYGHEDRHGWSEHEWLNDYPVRNEMPATGTMSQEIMKCPVCQTPINGRFSYSVEMSDETTRAEDGSLFMKSTVKLTGMEMRHDCIPKTTR